jgi:nitrogen fixation protein FixH
MTTPRTCWPHAIFGFIGLFAAAVVAFVVWSLKHRADLVAPDYYDQELQYQQRMDAQRRAADLGATVELRWTEGLLEVKLPATPAPTGTLTLYRPSASAMDRHFPIAVDGQGIQRIPLPDLAEGLWKIHVAWSAGGTNYFVERPWVHTP